MVLLDVIVGYYLPSLFGWIFLFFVLLVECLFLSKMVTKRWNDIKVRQSAVISNIVTTIIGFLILDRKLEGGYLLNWIPVDESRGGIRIDRTLFLFISSFVATLIVESIINILVLKKYYKKKPIFYGTLYVNLITYVIGAIVIFIYSYFNFKD